jgi:NAD(P)H dehydrogenase (quinone)
VKSLVVTSHPESASFNQAMAETVAETLLSLGHHVQLVDLHAEDFDPVVRRAQFPQCQEAARFEVMAAQTAQAASGDLSADILLHQQRLLAADNLVLQFPLWWWSLPAQLKGWIDRTFAAGFAYGGASLAGRSAMLTVTAETKAERFLAQGGDNPLHHIERGILKFCGFEVLPAFVVADVYDLGRDGRQARLAELRDHVRRHFRQTAP